MAQYHNGLNMTGTLIRILYSSQVEWDKVFAQDMTVMILYRAGLITVKTKKQLVPLVQ